MADAPVDALLDRVEDLTKGWLLALVEQAPLEEMPAIMAAGITRDGPRLFDAAVRALADDTDLRRLEAGSALEPLAASAGELVGARSPEAIARAVETFRAVLWSALRDELSDPSPDQLAELAERLALVAELVRLAALRRPHAEGERAPSAVGAAARAEPAREPAPRLVPAAPREPDPARRESQTPGAEPASARPDGLWVGALDDEIGRAERIGAPLSLLLAELEDADRMLVVEGTVGAESMFGRFAQSVRSAVRRQDILASESDTRAWIIARDTGRIGAHALALRVASAVRESPAWRGAPLAVSVGVAVLGDDGRTPDALIDAAEEAMFAAQASGISVVRADAPNVDPEPA